MSESQPSLFEDPASSASRDLEEAESLLSLMEFQGIGSGRALKLAKHFGTWDALLGAPPDVVHSVSGVELELNRRASPHDIPDGSRLVGFFDSQYPTTLREIKNPPAVLWVRGELFDQRRIAIVGARDATPWGVLMAETIAQCCVKNNVSVVSGLAFGIDIAAHRATVSAAGKTIAVIGSGIDLITPAAHVPDALEILEANGAVISEVVPGTPPSAQTLVSRNRIQSGMSAATVVVQCGETSGSLRTAAFAAEQHRIVAVPVPPQDEAGSQQNAGTVEILRNGIKDRTRTIAVKPLGSDTDLTELLRTI